MEEEEWALSWEVTTHTHLINIMYTICFTAWMTAVQTKCSETQAMVFFSPICPAVASMWQACKIFCCSLRSPIYPSSNVLIQGTCKSFCGSLPTLNLATLSIILPFLAQLSVPSF